MTGTKAKRFDTVRLRYALPAESLPEGAIGVVVEEFGEPPEAYEIEFCNAQGQTTHRLALTPDQFSILHSAPESE